MSLLGVLNRVIGWLEPYEFEGDWFNPEFRRMINAECDRQELQIPFDQRKDLQ